MELFIVFGMLFFILLFAFLIIRAMSEHGEKRPNHPVTDSDTAATINRLEQENKSLRNERQQLQNEILALQNKNEVLTKAYQKYSKRCDELIYWTKDSTASFLPPHMSGLYKDALYSPKLEKTLSGKFSFAYPLSVSGTVHSDGNIYQTTLMDCTCEDHRYRHVVCKHMLALALQVQAFASPNINPNDQ